MATLKRILVFALSVLSAAILLRSTTLFTRILAPLSYSTMSAVNGSGSPLPKTQIEWRRALDELPATPDKIPAFFFGHGSPALAFPESESRSGPMKDMGPRGPLASFLKDFGPALLSKYKPKGIVVFSAHWETSSERLGMSSLCAPLR